MDTAIARLDEQVYLTEDPRREGYETSLLDVGDSTY